MGKIIDFKHGPDSVGGVDPRLWDIVQHAIAVIPYDAQIRSGSERGKGDKGNHSKGYAVDVTLIDPATGKVLPDTVSKNNGATFDAYEQYAQAARVYQQSQYPELNKVFRWGGGFISGGTPGDLMHLDITPSMNGAMAAYNWEKGLGYNYAGDKIAVPASFGVARSNGGLGDTRLRRQIELAHENVGTLLPPASMASDAPTPMPSRPFGNTEPAAPVPRMRPMRPEPAPQTPDTTIARTLGLPLSAVGVLPRSGPVRAAESSMSMTAPIDAMAGGFQAGPQDRVMELARPQSMPTIATARTLGSEPQGTVLGAPVPRSRPVAAPMAPMPLPRPAVTQASAQAPISRPLVRSAAPAPFPRPAVQLASAPVAPIPRSRPVVPGAEPAPSPDAGGFNLGALLGNLGNTLGQKAQEVGTTLGNTTKKVVEGTGRALADTGEAAKEVLTNELLRTVGGRTLALNAALGITPAMRGEERQEKRQQAAPEGFGYGSTGKKLYRIGQTYQSSRGPVIFNGRGFEPAAAVRSEISIAPSRPSPTPQVAADRRARQLAEGRASQLDQFGNIK